jgi:hypothetical protein
MTIKTSKELMMMLLMLINSYQIQGNNLERIWVCILGEIRKKIILALAEYKTNFRLRDYQIIAFRELMERIDVIEVLEQSPFLYTELEAVRTQLNN